MAHTPTSDVTVLHCPTCLRPLSMTTHRQPFCTYCGKAPTEPVPGSVVAPAPDAPSKPSTAPWNERAPDGPAPAPSPTREARMVLCCADCETPLSTTAGGGSYCARCRLSPSMQDTFFMKMCPTCNVETKKPEGEDRRCPQCGERFGN